MVLKRSFYNLCNILEYFIIVFCKMGNCISIKKNKKCFICSQKIKKSKIIQCIRCNEIMHDYCFMANEVIENNRLINNNIIHEILCPNCKRGLIGLSTVVII
jgi:hypothetical protein